jgi:predicted signal transduction protein with EAL and GGDEF domain
MVALSQSLDIVAVAEGIETGAQAKRMEALGCTFGQGYFFAAPMEQAEIDRGVAGLATAVRRQRRRRTDAPSPTATPTAAPAVKPAPAPRTRTRTRQRMPADPTAA